MEQQRNHAERHHSHQHIKHGRHARRGLGSTPSFLEIAAQAHQELGLAFEQGPVFLDLVMETSERFMLLDHVK